MKNNIKPGEIWTFTDASAQTREALILNVFEDGYAEYVLLHPFRKGPVRFEVMGMGGVMYCDPRKVSFKHTDTFTGMSRGISAEKLAEMRLKAAEGIGFMDAGGDGLLQQLKSSQASVASMGEKIKELTIYKTLYEQFLKSVCLAMQGQSKQEIAPEQDSAKTHEPVKAEDKPLTQLERNRMKYAQTQSYIAVKCKRVGMSLSTLDRLTGHIKADGKGGTGAASHWAKGDSPAHWEELERIFPGLKAEAEAWAEKQKEVQ